MSTAEFVYTTLLKPRPLKQAANAMIRAVLPRTVRYGDVSVTLNPRDPVISGALAFRVYERAEMAFAARALRAGMTALDIGANVGLYSALFASKVGTTGRVIAFEPDAESFDYLQQTIRGNGFQNVTALRLAASDAKSVETLYTSSSNRGDSRLYSNELSDGELQVTTVRIDDHLETMGIREVDFVKIDVQGFEGHVIAGAEKIIRSSPNLTILSEFWPDGLMRAGTDAVKLLKLLETWGLIVHELLADGTTNPIRSKEEFVSRWAGRQYTNIVCSKSDPRFAA